MQKFLVYAVFCAVLVTFVQCSTKPPINAIFGSRQPGDERLLYKIVQQKSGWFFTKAVEDLDYPGKGAYSTANITYIEAINQKPDSGSTVTILKGGIGLPFVKLHFKSSRTEGFNYIVQIYGRLTNTPVQPIQPQPIYPPPGGVYPIYPNVPVQPVTYPNYPVRHY